MVNQIDGTNATGKYHLISAVSGVLYEIIFVKYFSFSEQKRDRFDNSYNNRVVPHGYHRERDHRDRDRDRDRRIDKRR